MWDLMCKSRIEILVTSEVQMPMLADLAEKGKLLEVADFLETAPGHSFLL